MGLKLRACSTALLGRGFQSLSVSVSVLSLSLCLSLVSEKGLEQWNRPVLCFSLTLSIVVGLMILQVWIAGTFFLQPKLGTADKQKPLALNNR